MHLPASIHTYFTAHAPEDSEAFAVAFAPDAIVRDEGHNHRGPQEIHDWWLAAKARYHHHAESIDITEREGRTLVRARVSGDFPGSPAVLTFAFSLASERIAALEIG